MTFEEWWMEFNGSIKWVDEGAKTAELVWEAGVQEGINRMYLLYDLCPVCRMADGVHKMDCGRGR